MHFLLFFAQIFYFGKKQFDSILLSFLSSCYRHQKFGEKTKLRFLGKFSNFINMENNRKQPNI